MKIVKKNLPHIHITVTSKRKRSRGKTYYMEENFEAMNFISKLRQINYKDGINYGK